jgi:hypothetical protein
MLEALADQLRREAPNISHTRSLQSTMVRLRERISPTGASSKARR